MNSMDKMKELYGDLFEEQLRLEDHFSTLAREALQRSLDRAEETCTTSTALTGQHLVSYGFDDARKAVQEWYVEIVKPRKGVKPAFVEILRDMEKIFTNKDEDGIEQNRAIEMLNMLTLIPLTCLLNHLGKTEGIILNNMAQIVSQEIQEECKVEAFIKTIPKHTLKGLENGIKERGDRHYKVYYARQAMVKKGFSWTNWNRKDSIHLSLQLLEIVINGSGFFTFECFSNDKGLKDEQSQAIPTPWLIEAWTKNNDKLLEKAHRNCPMIIPPLPWNGLNDGGYYGALHGRHTLLRSEALRAKNTSTFTSAYLKKFEETDISQVKQAINNIQETPWRINKKIFEILEAIIERGGDIGGVPGLKPLEQLPDLVGDYTEEELKAHKKEKWAIYRKDVTRETLALRAINHFKVAKEYVKYDRIYFPYNMDFRGRVYPISSFSPQSDDINKGLLEFADVPACTCMEDIGWLMVHGANVAGVDKVSFEARKQWVADNEIHIIKSALDPLGYLWWTGQDETSFQFLAFCFEWVKWRDWYKEHGTAKGFVCTIPIAFDGTCSGLQHYSAILRDPIGGKAVNLVPGDSPNDIYRVVAEKVEEALKKDVKEGTADEEVTYGEGEETVTKLKFGTRTLAQQWLAFGITRKVTKRSVMTLPYGSKEFGFKAQILEDVIKPAIKEGKGSMFLSQTQASSYMAKRIWQAVQTVVVKAMEGMSYLQKLSRAVCKEGQVITWTTPLGLPVQQAYMVDKNERIQLRLGQGIRRKIFINTPTGDIDKIAQVNGIAPNFIHSMDACHLQLTVLNAKGRGISHFALIHDSFGCPLSQAREMFKIIRESFLQLYTEHNVLEDFTEELSVFLEDPEDAPKLPKKGKLNLEVVLESQYMFA
jgi:DNA-directed RNA polymerase